MAFSADGSQLAAVVVKDIPLTDAEVPEKDQNEQESEEKEEETPPRYLTFSLSTCFCCHFHSFPDD